MPRNTVIVFPKTVSQGSRADAPTRNESELPYDPIGQDLYVTSDTIDLVNAVQSWYNETGDYDYDNNSRSGECGDYMQVGVFSVHV